MEGFPRDLVRRIGDVLDLISGGPRGGDGRRWGVGHGLGGVARVVVDASMMLVGVLAPVGGNQVDKTPPHH